MESQPRVFANMRAGCPAVIDLLASGQSIDLYYQTIHHRPIAMGNVSRVSADTAAATASILDDVAQGHYDLLRAMGFGFIVDHAALPRLNLPAIYEDRVARVYQLPIL